MPTNEQGNHETPPWAIPTEATGPQVQARSDIPAQPPTFEDLLGAQAFKTAQAGTRVGALIGLLQDSFEKFILETEAFYQLLRTGGGPSDNSTTNSTPTQTRP